MTLDINCWPTKANTNNYLKNCLGWKASPTPWMAIRDKNLTNVIIEIAEKIKKLAQTTCLIK